MLERHFEVIRRLMIVRLANVGVPFVPKGTEGYRRVPKGTEGYRRVIQIA